MGSHWHYRIRDVEGSLSYEIHPCLGDSQTTILLLHGQGSCKEAFTPLVRELTSSVHVVAFDQPCCGASSDVELAEVSSAYPEPEDYLLPFPGLRFIRELLVTFVLHKGESIPNADRSKGIRVAGGGLGGNLALCLGEREKRPTWLRDVVAWSPGSAWDRDHGRQILAASKAFQRAERLWTLADRGRFLEEIFCLPMNSASSSKPEPYYWYGRTYGDEEAEVELSLGCETNNYPKMKSGKSNLIRADYERLKDQFTPARAAWHWQMAGEQLAFSHRQSVRRNGWRGPAMGALQVDALLMAGALDNEAPRDMRRCTRELHEAASEYFRTSTNPYGQKVRIGLEVLAGYGHALHIEAPSLLARRLNPTGAIA